MYKCEYCNKSFKRESTIAAHMCKTKHRYMQRDEQHVKLGLKFFNDWYRLAMGSKTRQTYDKFAKSQYYAAFVRFGIYVLESRVLSPDKYMIWLVKESIQIDSWNKDSVYNRYLAEQNKKETIERALERFVIHAEKWSEKTGYHWTQYWTQANQNAIVFDITMGKISPWIFLGLNAASERLDSMPSSLLISIADTIDMNFWRRKLATNKPSIAWLEEIM